MNCVCFLIILLCSPLLVLCYSIFSTYPHLLSTSKYLRGFNNLKALFYNSFLYVFIMLSFLKSVLLYAIVGQRGVAQKLLFNYCHHLSLIVQTYILLNSFFEYFSNPVLNYSLLILSGDIESNPGPNNFSQNISVCYWNLNGISAHNYTKLAQL